MSGSLKRTASWKIARPSLTIKLVRDLRREGQNANGAKPGKGTFGEKASPQ